jgi:DNA polymerase-1
MRRITSKKRKRLVLLDTHAILHRAYHALPDFTAPDGSATGALYGLVAMLLKIVADLEPEYIAACFDLPGPTVRHEAYAEYKGTRAKIDDALISQIERSREVFTAFGIPLYEKEGFEADDLLGTIAHEMAAHPDIEVIIASGDMDTLQCVDDDRVKVYTLKKGLNDTILYDAKAVEARYGFRPELIPDYKGLRGDPSDNIKGVPGIGEKTATELLQKFGTIEELYKKLKKNEGDFIKKGIKPRMVELLKAHEEDAIFSKMLATIRIDAPIHFALPAESWKEGVDIKKIASLFDTLGFRTLKARAATALAARGGAEEFAEPLGPHSTNREDEGAGPGLSEIPQSRLQEAEIMLWLIASDFSNPSLEDIMAYTKAETFDEAYAELEKQLDNSGRVKDVYEDIEKPLIPILRAMEARGVLIDTEVLAGLAKSYRAELKKIESRIYKLAGKEFNISSPKQLGDILFDELGLKADKQKKTAGGQRSTRESELEKLSDQSPIIGDILEYREVQKLLSTYIDNLPPLLDKKNRLHAQFLQSGTSTGRMASANPNLQNIPLHSERGRAIRTAFVAPKGFELIDLDYSQIELRLAAILSGDEKMAAIFAGGRDVHTEVAAMVFNVPHDKVDAEMRRRAKVINFGILYGMGVNALRAQLGSTTAEAHEFLENYFHTFKTLAEYLERTKGFARKHGYTETLFGRRRQFAEMKSPLPYVRAQAERTAINAPLQGTQADIIKLAMVRIDKMLKDVGAEEDAHLLLQVHDELVYEIKKSRIAELAPKIKELMEGVLTKEQRGEVPILAQMKSGYNWGEMKSGLNI